MSGIRHLAEFNIGTLKYDWDDPRIADFQNNLDRVYAIAERSPGYIWHMPPDEMEVAQLDPSGPLGGNPRTASTLSVWETAAHLYAFTFNTLQKQFYDRRSEWYGAHDHLRFVMWWVEPDHLPSISEAVERMQMLEEHGPTDHAFNWAHLGLQPHGP